MCLRQASGWRLGGARAEGACLKKKYVVDLLEMREGFLLTLFFSLGYYSLTQQLSKEVFSDCWRSSETLEDVWM